MKGAKARKDERCCSVVAADLSKILANYVEMNIGYHHTRKHLPVVYA